MDRPDALGGSIDRDNSATDAVDTQTPLDQEPAAGRSAAPAHRASARSLLSRFAAGVTRGPMSRNVGAAMAVQLCLLVSGTLSARLLGPEKRGYVAILAAWPSAIGQLGAVGISLSATYFLSARLISGPDLISLLRRPAGVQIFVLTLISSAVILGYTFISGAPIVGAACLTLVVLPAVLCLDYGIAFLLGARRHAAVGLMRTISSALYAGGLVGLYVLHDSSLDAVMALFSGGAVVAGAIALIAGIRAALRVKSNESMVTSLGIEGARRKVLAFGRKGYIGYLSPVDSFRIDQLVVGILVSPRALGLYVVGAAFTNLPRLIAYNIGLSSTAEIAAHPGPRERNRAVRRTLLLAAGILAIVTAVLEIFVIVAIPLLFGNSYRSAIPIAEILFIASWLLSMKRIAVDAMRGAGEAQIGTRAEMVNLLLFLVLCGPLSIFLGGPGVAIALVLASAGGSLVLVPRLARLEV